MVEVAQRRQTAERIDYHLDYLLREWQALPDIAAEWNAWEEYEQFDFVIEWTIRVDRLGQLRRWADEGLLTPAQLARFRDLLTLIDLHRPTFERLLVD